VEEQPKDWDDEMMAGLEAVVEEAHRICLSSLHASQEKL
jgi:hypothetical protein